MIHRVNLRTYDVGYVAMAMYTEQNYDLTTQGTSNLQVFFLRQFRTEFIICVKT
jgi:hypothetical protein